MRPPELRDDEMIVDCFAGGGGTSTGIAMALGRDPDIAINHSAEAIAMHAANHPTTTHYREDVWRVDPRKACAGRDVGMLWLSPACTHFSRAKGAKPLDRRIRSLAWAATRWAHEVSPRVIALENVEELSTWGPLANGRPDPARLGQTFRAFVRKLQSYGYHVQWRSLVAANFGSPTTRRRLFLVARRDGQPIVWPTPTHGKGLAPWRPASGIIDWSLPAASIFGRSRPLADATNRRIAEGLRRFVVECTQPFMRPSAPTAAAWMAKHYGGPNGHAAVGHTLDLPLSTVTAQDHPALVTARTGAPSEAVRAFLVKYYGSGGQTQSLFDPLHTVTSKARFGLVTIHGEPIADITMRMLSPRELFGAQGFPSTYVIDPEMDGKPLTKTAQIACAGNSVPPQLAEAVVGAQFGTRRAVAS